MRIVPMFASLAVDTRRSIQCFASLAVDTRRSFTLAAQSRRTYNGICHFSSRDRAVQHHCHHPCWKAAYFLPCTRPPDGLRFTAQRGRINYGPSQLCAFVATRSGFQTMPGEHGAAEDDTAPAAVTGAAAGPGRRYGAAAGPGRRFTSCCCPGRPRPHQQLLAIPRPRPPLPYLRRDLQEHYISPHQVLLDSDIDHFSHPDAGPALMSAAGQFLPEPSSDADESA